MIKLDEVFKLDWDNKQWVLAENITDRIDKRTGKEIKGYVYKTYYPNLRVALKAWLDKSVRQSEPQSIKDILTATKNCHKRIDKLHNEFKEISYGKQEV